MTVPSQIFDYLILPIREADQREGKDFLKRYLLGPQSVWETTDQKIKDIPNLWSVVECPDEFLKFLKWIVGWTSELDSVTQDLIFDELRRLISISGRLWKLRGPEDTIIDVLRFATGQRNRIWNWFDFRWVLDETELGEEQEGRDPWMVDLPTPTDVGASQESNLRIVSNPAWDAAEEIRMRNLIVNLLKLMRASGERWEITYLGFLDQFIVDGDDTQWDVSQADFLTVAGGTLTLGNVTEAADEIQSVVPSTVWSQAMYAARLRTWSPSPSTSVSLFHFHWQSLDDTYFLAIFPLGSDVGPAVWLMRTKGGGDTILAVVDLPLSPIYPGVYYTYRVTIVDEGSNKRIKVFIDGDEVADVPDNVTIDSGTVGFATNYAAMEVDEVEVIPLPAESDYVDINS